MQVIIWCYFLLSKIEAINYPYIFPLTNFLPKKV